MKRLCFVFLLTAATAHAQVKLVGTLSYEKTIAQFPLDVKKIDAGTPVLLKNPEKPAPIAEIVMMDTGEGVSDDPVPQKEEVKAPPPKPPLAAEQYWLRTKPGVLIPVKITGSILDFNSTEILAWDYHAYVLSRYRLSNGKFKREQADTLRNIPRDCWLHSLDPVNGKVLFVNEVSTKERTEDAERLDFYDASFRLLYSYKTQLRANAEMRFVNQDSLIIAEYANEERKIHLSYVSLSKGVLASTDYETDMKVSSLPMHFLDADSTGRIVIVYNAYDKRAAQVLVFHPDLSFSGKYDLDDYVSYACLLKDSPLLALTYTGSALFGGAKFQKVNLQTFTMVENKPIPDLYGTNATQWKVFLPFQEKKLNERKAMGFLTMYYSPLQAFPEKRKLVIVDAVKNYTLDLVPLPNQEFITVPLSGRRLAIYRGKQVKLYEF